MNGGGPARWRRVQQPARAKRRPGAVCGLLALLWWVPLRAWAADAGHAPARAPEIDPAAIEQRLFDLTNAERKKLGLGELQPMPELAELARGHSLDMAGRDTLSHFSAAGASLEDRLVSARFYFSAAGENIAQSTSTSAEEIHLALMRSPEHRKNILDPRHDTIGIGAVVDDGAVIYVTEDFLERLTVLEGEPARERAEARIQEIRRSRSLPPLAWDRKADVLARDLARARARGKPYPPIPSSLGEVNVLFVTSPRFEDLAERADVIGSSSGVEAGLGVAFGRPETARGGAYFISLVLLAGVRHLELNDRERGELVRAVINKIRLRVGLEELAWRDSLAANAGVPKVVGPLQSVTRDPKAVQTRRREMVFTYETIDLEQVPAELETRMLNPGLRGMGVSAAFEKNREFPRGVFRVTIVAE